MNQNRTLAWPIISACKSSAMAFASPGDVTPPTPSLRPNRHHMPGCQPKGCLSISTTLKPFEGLNAKAPRSIFSIPSSGANGSPSWVNSPSGRRTIAPPVAR